MALLAEERPAAERHDLARALDHLHYGDTAKAGQIAQTLADAAPDDPAILKLLAVIRFRQGDDAGTRVAFEPVLAADPQHEDARRGLDQLEIRAGNIAAVEERLCARLDRQPGCVPCAIELASLLTADGRGGAYGVAGGLAFVSARSRWPPTRFSAWRVR